MILLCIIMTIAAWGIAAVFDTVAARHEYSSFGMLTWMKLFTLPLLLIYTALGWWQHTDIRCIYWSLLSAGVVFVAWWGYFQALKQAHAGKVVVITSCYPLLSVFLFTIFFGQSLQYVQWAGLIVIIASVIYLNYEKEGGLSLKAFTYALLACAAWSIWSVCDWQALQYGTTLQAFYFSSLGDVIMLPFLFGWLLYQGTSLAIPRAAIKPLLGAQILYTAAAFSLYYALGHANPSWVIGTTAVYPILSVALLHHLRVETSAKGIWFASAIAVAGVILLQI